MNKKIFVPLATLSILLPLPSFAGELGVSHSISNSVRSGTGKLTVESIRNVQVDEQSVSFSGQLSNAEFNYLGGGLSLSGQKPTMVDGDDKDKGKGNDKTGASGSLGISGGLGSGEVKQISASVGTRNLSSTESIKSNLVENYSFSDSVFTQTSSTFSR